MALEIIKTQPETPVWQESFFGRILSGSPRLWLCFIVQLNC